MPALHIPAELQEYLDRDISLTQIHETLIELSRIKARLIVLQQAIQSAEANGVDANLVKLRAEHQSLHSTYEQIANNPELIIFAEMQSKHAVATLKEIAKHDLRRRKIHISESVLDFVIIFISQFYKEYNSHGKKAYDKFGITLAEVVLIAGMLLEYCELQTKKPFERSKAKDVLFPILCNLLPFKNILEIDTAFYASSLVVLSNNMLAAKTRSEHANALCHELSASAIALASIQYQDLCYHYAISMQAFLAYLFDKCRIVRGGFQNNDLATFIRTFPFAKQLDEIGLAKQSQQGLQHKLVHGILFMHSVNNYTDVHNRAAITRIMHRDPSRMASECIAVVRTLSKHHAELGMRIVVDECIKRMMRIIIDFLLHERVAFNDKKQILILMREYFDARATRLFGICLRQALQDYWVFDAQVLEAIYDLRLGLRDRQHMAAQIRSFLLLCSRLGYTNHAPSKEIELIPGDLNRVWAFIGGSGSELKRILLCTDFISAEYILSESLARKILQLIKLITTASSIKDLSLEPVTQISCDVAPAMIQKTCEELARFMTREGHTLLRFNLQHNITTSTGVYKWDLGVFSLLYSGHDNWVLYSPELPQEYLRCHRDSMSVIADYLHGVDHEKLAKDRDWSNAKHQLVFNCFACLAVPRKVRRSQTPITELSSSDRHMPRSSSLVELPARSDSTSPRPR